jgi:protein-tyrosine kinase
MSKFFDQTQKAQEWALREGASGSLDLEGLLTNVKETVAAGERISTDLSVRRLEGCRKMRLPNSKNSAVILSGNEFTTTMAMESYKTLRTRLMRLQAAQGLRSIVMGSAVPGEGKTLTSLNLALTCAQLRDQRVLLIDGDLRTGGLTKLMEVPPGPGLSEVLAGKETFEGAMVMTDLPNLSVIGAGNHDTSPTELFAVARWKELLGWASETFQTILVDSPPILTFADFDLISAACDAVLVVVRAQHTPREILKKAAAQLEAKKLLGVVYNGAVAIDRNHYQHAGYYGNGKDNGLDRELHLVSSQQSESKLEA